MNVFKRCYGNPWAVLVVLSFGFFMTLLDLQIVNIAIPSFMQSLHATIGQTLWILNAYILVLAVFLITAGRLGDSHGIRKLFALGVAIFTISSLFCGLSQNPIELILFRFIQGLGAAVLLPQTMTFIVKIFPTERRGTALGIWGMVGGVAAVAGPSLGGLIVSSLGWRWIFFINVPVGAMVFIFTYLIVPEIRQHMQRRLDFVGVLIASLSVLFLTYGLIEGQRYNWSGFVWGVFAMSAVFFTIFYFQQRSRQSQEPLIPFALFEDRNYTLMNIVAISFTIGVLGLMLLLSIYFQSILGYSALKAGLTLVPASVVSMCVSPFAGKISNRVDGKYLLFLGLLLTEVGLIWITLIMRNDTLWTNFILPMSIVGLGNGLLVSPMAVVAMKGVKIEVAGAASGVMNTVRQLGAVGGSAAVGALLQNRILAVSTPFHRSTEYVTAIKETMILPIVVILVGIAACAAAHRTIQLADPHKEAG